MGEGKPVRFTAVKLSPHGWWGDMEAMGAAGRDAASFDFSYMLQVGDKDAYTPHATSAQDKHHASAATLLPTAPYDRGAVTETVGCLIEAGFNHIYVQFNWDKPKDLMGHTEWFAAQVMPAFR